MAQRLCWSRWQNKRKLLLNRILPPPFAERSLIEMQPVLLRTDDHPGPHKSHESDYLISGKSVTIDEICTDEASSSAKASFAVYRYCLLLYRDGFMSDFDELLHYC